MSLLTDMVEAFAEVTYGNIEPDTVRCTTATAKRIYIAVRENEVRNRHFRGVPEGFKWTDLTFQGARFLLDDHMSEGLVRLECSKFVREVTLK